MKVLRLLGRPKPAKVAHDRLQILLAHERSVNDNSDLLATLRDDILKAVAKYVPVAIDQVDVTMDRRDMISTLQIDVQIPV
jgi:cell division topological specificity factor